MGKLLNDIERFVTDESNAVGKDEKPLNSHPKSGDYSPSFGKHKTNCQLADDLLKAHAEDQERSTGGDKD